jgi:ankyrin repeat protein
MPEAVQDVERAIDDIVGTEKCIKGNDQTASALVAENWNFRADTEQSRTLFANVVAHGSDELIQLFIEHGASPLSTTTNGESPLAAAAKRADLELVKQLLGERTEVPTQLLSCSLAAAASSGSLPIVQFLIEKGADANGPPCSSKNNRTVLMEAVQSNKPEVIREILKHHAGVNAKDAMGNTALALFLEGTAENPGARKIISLLIQAGADVNSRDTNGQAPIFRACSAGTEAIRALAEAGADLNAKDRNGQTPLMSCFGNPAVKALVDAGADLTVRNPYGFTAAEEARNMGANDKAELLEAALNTPRKR